jgi:hypothetical protein
MYARNAAGSKINLLHESAKSHMNPESSRTPRELQTPVYLALLRSLPRRNHSTLQHAKKRYSCPQAKTYDCDDKFTTSGHARRHLRRHTGQKTHLCSSCDMRFTRADNLRQHQQSDRHRRRLNQLHQCQVPSMESIEVQ